MKSNTKKAIRQGGTLQRLLALFKREKIIYLKSGTGEAKTSNSSFTTHFTVFTTLKGGNTLQKGG